MRTKPEAMTIIVDIDGTLADITHRLHFVQKAPKNWKAFFNAMDRDTPIPSTVGVVQSMWTMGHRILITTGRPASYEPMTVGWLREHRIRYDHMFMRAAGDTRPDDVVKRDILRHIRRDYEPDLAIDDRDRVVDMWRQHGVPCWQVAPGGF